MLFGKFVGAVAKRFRGKASFYSLWNEPNLENYLLPQRMKTSAGIVDMGGKQLRELYIAGYRAIRANDRRRAGRVLFGETSAISSPRDTLFSALCLNRRGRPYTGAIKRLQGCAKPSDAAHRRAGRAPVQPERAGVGVLHQQDEGLDAHGLPRAAPTACWIWPRSTSACPRAGGSTSPSSASSRGPPTPAGSSLNGQARALNESDRLFFDDKRVKSVAQFELFDVPDLPSEDVFNSGLREQNGKAKPALAAWRLPLVVTRRRANRVEVWGQVRPARGRVRAVVQVARSAKGPFRTLRRVRTNRAGYFRFEVRRAGASRLSYRLRWKRHTSRVAKAGRRIKYKRG